MSRNLAFGLSRWGYHVDLATVSAPEHGHDTTPGVAAHCLGASRVRWSVPALFRLVRSLRPDLILSNMAHLNLAVLAMRPLFPRHTRVVVRNDGGMRPERLGPLARGGWRRLHRRADAIICQSDSMAAEFAVQLGSRDRLRILPNPIDVDSARHADAGASRWDGPGPHLLAVGRLVVQKGFDLLLRAFLPVLSEFPHAELVILGGGKQFESLQRLTGELGIARHVHFAGQVSSPELWFAGAALYVQPSREDALPNALLEAAAAGLPIVSTPAQGGLLSLLTEKPGTWIASEVSAAALADAIAQALRSLNPGQRFAHPWIEPFAMPNAIPRYDELIRTVLSS